MEGEVNTRTYKYAKEPEIYKTMPYYEYRSIVMDKHNWTPDKIRGFTITDALTYWDHQYGQNSINKDKEKGKK